MTASTRPRRASRASDVLARDRGAVDVSIQMLFGFVAVLFAMLLVFDTASYWHARNVLDEAAAEGARVAAAFDGSCTTGSDAASRFVADRAGSWAGSVSVVCVDGATISVTVSARTPGVLSGALGLRASATETAPKER